jgi:hypothetical protein
LERPDIALIGSEWPARALLRAQLIDEGYEVVASDGWPIPRQFLQPRLKPRLVIVDLRGLANPVEALSEIRALFGRERVLVISALGVLPPEQLRQFGFQVVDRPAAVQDIVSAVARMLA